MVITEDAKATLTLLDGTVNEVQCNDLSISKQCVSGSGFELGGVCSAQLQMTIKLENVNRYQMIGATINLQLYRAGEWHNAGVYNVTSAKRRRDIITLSASDNMVFFDGSAVTVNDNKRKLNLIAEFLRTQRTIYETLQYIVELAGLELAQSQEEIESMLNGLYSTIVFEEITNDCPRDWLSWCAEFLGGFAYADENGKIAVKQFETTISEAITREEIQSDTTDIADFVIAPASVETGNYDGTWGQWYIIDGDGEPVNDGRPNTIVLDLTDNYLVRGMYYLGFQYMDFLKNILDSIIGFWYRPFNATVHSDKLFRLGQRISIEDYDGQFYDTVITHITYTLNGGYQLKCAGDDTRLLAQTRTRSALKRESEKLQTQISNAKGIPLTQVEFDSLESAGKLVDGQTYFIIG